MDQKGIRTSSLFRRLLADADALSADVEEFNCQYRSFVQRHDPAVMRILRCHLIVEHYLDSYLQACNPAITNWDGARLSFSQKLALAGNSHTTISLLVPGLRYLNQLRNRVAHDLEAAFKPSDLDPIRRFISNWHKAAGKPIREGLDLIEDFTVLASSWLFAYAQMIDRHSKRSGLHGLLDWLTVAGGPSGD